MSFQKRNLFAAMAALAGAIVASHAAAFPSVKDSATPDLTLVVWDTSSSVTYFRDLGQTWSAATVGSDFASSLPTFVADANWSRFLTSIGGAVNSTTFYDVVSGTLTPTSTQILVTTGGAGPSGPNTTLTAVNSQQLQNAINSWSSFAVNNASTGSASPNFNTASDLGVTPNVHGSNIQVSGNPGEASSGTPKWLNGFGQTTFTTFANVGSTMNFFSMSGGTALTKATVTTLPGQWLLGENGSLTYTVAAVPEPGSWALLAAGLGMVGLIARRRLKTL